MRPVVTVLQDHTKFMQRIYESAQADFEGRPLSVAVLEAVRLKMLGVAQGGQWVPLAALQRAAEGRTKEARKAALLMAEAVEGVVEAWYCIYPDDGLQWLQSNAVGPVIHWGDGWWWGKIKGVHIEASIKFLSP